MDDYTRKRIENITEDDFWNSFRRDVPGLTEAIDAGLGGRRKQAYSNLCKYHSSSLAQERAAWLRRWGPQALESDKSEIEKNHEAAEAVMRHEICGWHTRKIKFGPIIDFNADFGRSGQYGFHYLGWLYPLLKEYTLTGDKRYALEFLNIIGQYYEQRTSLTWRIPGLHPVYYELGARAKTSLLLGACAILAPAELPEPGTYEAMVKLLLGFARSLFRIQKSGYRSGNWQIVGSRTLYVLGCAFCEFREAARWRERAENILDEHLKRDFFSDGGHSERCWGYGWMSLEGMLDHYRDGLRYGQLVGPRRTRWTRFLKKAFRWFAKSTAPGNLMLNYGDGSISSAAVLQKRVAETFPEMSRESGMFGVDRSRSYCLTSSGYAFMRAGNGDGESPYLSINFGAFGGGHTHTDILDFSLWCYGQPLIEEVGRFNSYDQPLNPFFYSADAHNQIVLPHLPIDRQAHRGQEIIWQSTGQADFFAGMHQAYRQAAIRRHIIFLKPEQGVGAEGIMPDRPSCCWIIYDVISADEYVFQAQNILHAPMPFVVDESCCRARIDADPSCLIVCARTGDLRRITTEIDYSKDERGENPSPWDKERHRLTFWKWREIGDPRPITFLTVLAPFRGKHLPQLTVTEIELSSRSGEAGFFQISLDGRELTVLFNPAADSLSGKLSPNKVLCPDNVPMALRFKDDDWLKIQGSQKS